MSHQPIKDPGVGSGRSVCKHVFDEDPTCAWCRAHRDGLVLTTKTKILEDANLLRHMPRLGLGPAVATPRWAAMIADLPLTPTYRSDLLRGVAAGDPKMIAEAAALAPTPAMMQEIYEASKSATASHDPLFRDPLELRAAGLLGARWLQLKREGWTIIRHHGAPRITASHALGPLPGAKITQLHEAGIDLRRPAGVGPTFHGIGPERKRPLAKAADVERAARPKRVRAPAKKICPACNTSLGAGEGITGKSGKLYHEECVRP